MIIIFNILAVLIFLFTIGLLLLSFSLFTKIDETITTANDLQRLHRKTVEDFRELYDKVSKYKQVADEIHFKQEELESTFSKLEKTATQFQLLHRSRIAMLDLMKR